MTAFGAFEQLHSMTPRARVRSLLPLIFCSIAACSDAGSDGGAGGAGAAADRGGASSGAASNAGSSANGAAGTALVGGTSGAAPGGSSLGPGGAGTSSGGAAGIGPGGSASAGSANAGTTAGGSATAGAAGTNPTGGMGGAAGGSGGTSNGACMSPVKSTSTRPQLTSEQASSYTVAKYLARTGPFNQLITDNWDPTAGLGSASSFTADATVAADGSGTHTTLQAALNAVSGSARRYILVKPGTYRGQVSYSGSTPVTVYGASTDATQVVIVNNKPASEGASETLSVKSNGFQLMNLSLSNDFPTPMSGSDIQALALLTNGDKIVVQNVRMHGFQDTVQLRAPDATTIARVYVKDTFIEGDVDFIYGNATVVFDGVTVHYLSSRRGTGSGILIAPSTSVDNALGFLFIRSKFTADAAAPNDKAFLGRSWDTSSTKPTPNGQAVIRESTIGAHVDRDTPWTSAATSGRPYSASGNRFYEYCNNGPGAAP